MGRRNRHKRCTCHTSLHQHLCHGCGQYGHLRNLCPTLREFKKTNSHPCQLCNGEKHVTSQHYCYYCSYYPKLEFCCSEDQKYETTCYISWVWLRSFWVSDEKLIKQVQGHDHTNCPRLKKDHQQLKLDLDKIEEFYNDLMLIEKLKNDTFPTYYSFSTLIPKIKGQLVKIHYWKQSSCLAVFWQELSLGLLVISPIKEKQSFDSLLKLLSIFLVHRAKKQADKYLEDCKCHQDALNRCLISLINLGKAI